MPPTLDKTAIQLQKLYEFDAKLDLINAESRSLPVKITEAEAPLKELAQNKDTLELEIQQLQEQKQGFEKVVAEKNALKDNTDKRIQSVKTNEGYQAGLREIENADTAIAEAEEQILTIMETLERLQPKLKAAESDYASKVESLSTIRTEVEEKLQANENKRQAMAGKRPAIEKEVEDPKLLSLYEVVRKRHLDALSFTKSDFCGVCQITIPPQILNQTRKMEKVQQCPSCKRILIWQEDQ